MNVRGPTFMARSKFVIAVLFVLSTIVVAALSFRYGAHVQKAEENIGLAYTQAVLAYGHYRTYERIESLLERKCFSAAMTELRESKKLQLVLASDNLRASNNHPELVEYIRLRDEKFLDTIMAGTVPHLTSYTTTCP